MKLLKYLLALVYVREDIPNDSCLIFGKLLSFLLTNSNANFTLRRPDLSNKIYEGDRFP